MTRQDAIDALRSAGLDPAASPNFFALSSAQVDALLTHADRLRYRKPRNANGSRARYFYAFARRVIARGRA